MLTWACLGKNEVITYNITTGQKNVLSGAPRPLSFLLSKCVVWLCALFLVCFIVLHAIRIVNEIIQNFRHRKTREAEAGAALVREVHTAWNIYGRNAFVLLFAFIAMTCVISVCWGEKILNSMESSVRSKAADLADLPGKVFGDYLADIDSAKDYNGKSYKMLNAVGSSICFSKEGSEFDFGLSIFRRFPDGKIMVVADT